MICDYCRNTLNWRDKEDYLVNCLEYVEGIHLGRQLDNLIELVYKEINLELDWWIEVGKPAALWEVTDLKEDTWGLEEKTGHFYDVGARREFETAEKLLHFVSKLYEVLRRRKQRRETSRDRKWLDNCGFPIPILKE